MEESFFSTSSRSFPEWITKTFIFRQSFHNEQWNYTTSNGVNLLLIRSEKEFKECIIANLNESYVVINITDDASDDPEEKQKSKHDLELFAECFDFTAIP